MASPASTTPKDTTKLVGLTASQVNSIAAVAALDPTAPVPSTEAWEGIIAFCKNLPQQGNLLELYNSKAAELLLRQANAKEHRREVTNLRAQLVASDEELAANQKTVTELAVRLERTEKSLDMFQRMAVPEQTATKESKNRIKIPDPPKFSKGQKSTRSSVLS